VHHKTEEAVSFPLLEIMTREKGVMDTNIAQHKAFHHGLNALEVYATACQNYKAIYDGSFVRKIISEFGMILTEHLADEIETLEAMNDYEERIDWEIWTDKTKEHAISLPGMVCTIFHVEKPNVEIMIARADGQLIGICSTHDIDKYGRYI